VDKFVEFNSEIIIF